MSYFNVGYIPDLIDLIVANLASSKKDLSSCSLVSAAWLPCVRPYLFSTIRVSQTDSALLSEHISKFLAFISSSPFICGYIRGVCFSRDDRPDPGLAMNSQVVSSILSLLPRLHTLRFINMVFDGHAIGILFPMPSHKLRLLEFQLILEDSYTTEDVLDVLGIFSHIGELRLSSRGSLHAGYGAADSIKVFPPAVAHPPYNLVVSKFVVKDHLSSYQPLIERLFRTRTIRTVESLEARVLGNQTPDWDVLVFMTNQMKATLQHLSLDPVLFVAFHDWFYPGYLETFNFICQVIPTLPHLRSFSLQSEVSSDARVFSDIWSLFGSAVSRLPSSTRHVRLMLNPRAQDGQMYGDGHSQVSDIWSRDGLDWEPLRAAFDRFGKLETATFATGAAHVCVDRRRDLEAIQRELPDLDRKGVLQYQFIQRDFSWNPLARMQGR
ncbi:hypothetical protein PHLCEN_2v5729 [Hermanssonia centrifuga]|uniref:F-box domain-containing protein n=1 Tax=Hermanssonia centrifuga TaxID=98765 RepID=A0A2R6P1J2_9APHY|nr:hypothetical protein PHLCEN_2v5729 [Hermanssonia centrifuga]